MPDEVVTPAEIAAPEVVETASTTEAVVSTEVTPEVVNKPAKTFTQEEVDHLIGKRLALAERKRDRERPEPQPVVETPKVAAKPNPDDFSTTQDYIEALTEWKVDQRVSEKLTERETKQREAREQAAHQTVAQQYQKQVDVAMVKYEDFDEVTQDPSLPITTPMAHAIQLSEVGAELIYHLGKNRTEAERISKLHPLAQARELGKLELKLASDPPARQSTAPDPIKPVAPRSSATQIYDTTDPRSTKTMSTSEWIAADRKRQEAKWRAAHS